MSRKGVKAVSAAVGTPSTSPHRCVRSHWQRLAVSDPNTYTSLPCRTGCIPQRPDLDAVRYHCGSVLGGLGSGNKQAHQPSLACWVGSGNHVPTSRIPVRMPLCFHTYLPVCSGNLGIGGFVQSLGHAVVSQGTVRAGTITRTSVASSARPGRQALGCRLGLLSPKQLPFGRSTGRQMLCPTRSSSCYESAATVQCRAT